MSGTRDARGKHSWTVSSQLPRRGAEKAATFGDEISHLDAADILKICCSPVRPLIENSFLQPRAAFKVLIAFLDARVLFRTRLNNLLLHLAEVKAFEPVLSDDILSEWMRNLHFSKAIPPKTD